MLEVLTAVLKISSSGMLRSDNWLTVLTIHQLTDYTGRGIARECFGSPSYDGQMASLKYY
jgi:hypothetical protein